MKFVRLVLASWCAVQLLHADLTLRHSYSVSFGAFVPPQGLDSLKAQWANRLPGSTTIMIKGDRVHTTLGPMFAITDYAKGTVALLDPVTRRFAALPLEEFPAKFRAAQYPPPMPPDAQRIFDNLKVDVTTARAPRTTDIQGIRTTEDTLTMTMQVMGSIPLRTELRFWTAAVEDLRGNPELRELAKYLDRPATSLDPVERMDKLLDNLPGMGERLRAPIRQILQGRDRTVIRLRVATFMPAFPPAPGRDAAPTDPVTEVTLDLAGLSLAPLPDTSFDIPAGYRSAAMEDLLAALFAHPQTAPAAQPPAQIPSGERPLDPSGGERVYHVGNGVSVPQILRNVEPSYTEAARAARIQGTVLLDVVVLPDGTAGQIKVLRSLDPGLDQKAIEAVRQWKFKPAFKDGRPVAVQSTIEVSFHLM